MKLLLLCQRAARIPLLLRILCLQEFVEGQDLSDLRMDVWREGSSEEML